MKKFIAIFLVLAMVLSVSAVFAEGERVLNICTPNSDGLRSIYPLFEAATGITIKSESLGTGDCMARIKAEKEQEYCSFDLMYGGSLANYVANADLFQEYYSPEDEFLMEAYRNKLGFCTNYTVDGSVLLVNDKLLGELGIEVKGYADLLQPELKGKIVSADPSASSSAFCQLTNWLLVMGEGETAAEKYESDAAWKFTEDLLKGQDVKLTSGSSAVYKGVINGEYAVGLTYEDPCVTMIKDGAENVHIVYPVEGTVFLPAQIGIPKNSKHVDEAMEFIDFMLSEEAQKFLAEKTTSRNIRPVEYTNEDMTPLADIFLAYEDSEYVIAHTADLKTRVADIINK